MPTMLSKLRTTILDWRTIGRWAIGIVIIIVILWSLSFDKIAQIFSTVAWIFVFINLIVTMVLRLLAGIKWHLILRIQDRAVKLMQSVAAHFVGTAVGAVTPVFGSDLAVGYAYYQQSRQGGTAISAILVDRIIGIYLLIVVGNVAVLLNLERIIALPWLLVVTSSALMAAIVMPIAVLLLNRYRSRLPFKLLPTKIESLLRTVVNDLKAYWNRGKDVLVQNCILSFIVQMLRILYLYILALAVGSTGSIADYAVVAPMMFLIMALPLPAPSIGLEQGAFLVMLGMIGVPGESAFAMAVLNRLLTMISVLPGVVCIWWGWGLQRRQDGQIELGRD